MLRAHDERPRVARVPSGRSTVGSPDIRVMQGGRAAVVAPDAADRAPKASERSALFRCWRCGEWRLPYIRHRCDPARRVPAAARREWAQIPCPRCGNVAFSIPAQGEPWRRCGGPRGCGFEWLAEVAFAAGASTTKEVRTND